MQKRDKNKSIEIQRLQMGQNTFEDPAQSILLPAPKFQKYKFWTSAESRNGAETNNNSEEHAAQIEERTPPRDKMSGTN